MKNATPRHLYKILSLEHWLTSETGDRLSLSSNDDNFVHFATHEQLDRIIGKYWADVPQFVLLTIDPTKLVGKLVFEANQPGGALYYHLYNGYIPLTAVEKAEMGSPLKKVGPQTHATH